MSAYGILPVLETHCQCLYRNDRLWLGVRAEPEPEPAALAEPEPESRPEPESALEPAPEPVAVPDPWTIMESAVEPEPVAAPDGIIGVAAMFDPSIPDMGSAFDVVVSPEVLDEPLPGAGWESSLAPLADEDVEELFPIPAEPEIVDFETVPAVEAPVNGGPAEAAAASASISTDDLRARIEETRRRIRRELDEPFLGQGDVTLAPQADSEVVSRLAAEVPEPAVQERLKRLADAAEASVAPVVVPEAVAPEEGGAPSEEAPLPVTEAKEPAEARPQPDMELGVDYNAMRARIEQTRGRLKAKAFDAMMTGESALLGRESPEKAAERPGPAVLDHDLDQTIETTLREEEDL